ncbi:MAG TPA: GNAT family N-acetyltransferase [Candidatus Paceibacterota bacterium]|nr:GNAT family N-acetyltransferase [Candidatus Paceibacterota bacterium]
MEELSQQEKPKIEIALARPEDAWGTKNVFYQTWLTTYPNKEVGVTVEDVEDRYKDRFSEKELARRKDRLANPPSNEIFLVAKEGDEVVGACVLTKRGNFNQLQAIYVLPEYQGRGIGKMLWSEALNFFGTEKDIVVEVATYNTNAIEFYKKLGFQDTGKRWKDEYTRMKSGAIIPEMEMILKARK